MADLSPRRCRKAFPADGLLTPRAHNLAISLAGEHVTCVIKDRLDLSEEGAGVAEQLTTAGVRHNYPYMQVGMPYHQSLGIR